jgi:isopenicillin N synthase-like dioxygenase
MRRAGAAWRGWFPLHGELISGKSDDKEGLYFGDELAADDVRVRAGWPLHGANQWPKAPADLRPAVNAYLARVSRVAEVVMQGVLLALDLNPERFQEAYLARPTRLFRIFHYPPTPPGAWGVGEHTDYGLLTLLAQDQVAGLEVKGPRGWLSAPPIAGTLVCNIGDMLERLTGGRFVSTPHRVVNASGKDRLSFLFFYDPDFTALITPVLDAGQERHGEDRWDAEDVHAYSGSYGDYLTARVGRVFPDLKTAAKG